MVLHYLSENDLLNGKKIRTMTLPDEFQDHCNLGNNTIMLN